MTRAKGNQRRVQANKALALSLSGEPASAIARKLRVTREQVFRLVASPLNKAPRLPKKWKAPSSPDEAREWLKAVADHLLAFPNGSSRFRFVGNRIKKYLRNHEKYDLYRELGLVEPPGRRRTFQERMSERDRGHKIVKSKQDGKRWHEIGEQVGLKDTRSLKRIFKKYSSLLTKEKQLAVIDRAMKDFLREESL